MSYIEISHQLGLTMKEIEDYSDLNNLRCVDEEDYLANGRAMKVMKTCEECDQEMITEFNKEPEVNLYLTCIDNVLCARHLGWWLMEHCTDVYEPIDSSSKKEVQS